jgi:hypothetical protein
MTTCIVQPDALTSQHDAMVFDGFRRSFDDLLARATKPEERHLVASRMKETLVQARIGLDDLRAGLDAARKRLTVEEGELETVRRRKRLAEGISDAETVAIAVKYEEMHTERVDVVRRKVSVQEAELALAEREVAQMTAELKAVVAGTDPRATAALDAAAREVPDPAAETSALRDEIDALGRARSRSDREADADRRLDELKRRMGK